MAALFNELARRDAYTCVQTRPVKFGDEWRMREGLVYAHPPSWIGGSLRCDSRGATTSGSSPHFASGPICAASR